MPTPIVDWAWPGLAGIPGEWCRVRPFQHASRSCADEGAGPSLPAAQSGPRQGLAVPAVMLSAAAAALSSRLRYMAALCCEAPPHIERLLAIPQFPGGSRRWPGMRPPLSAWRRDAPSPARMPRLRRFETRSRIRSRPLSHTSHLAAGPAATAPCCTGPARPFGDAALVHDPTQCP